MLTSFAMTEVTALPAYNIRNIRIYVRALHILTGLTIAKYTVKYYLALKNNRWMHPIALKR